MARPFSYGFEANSQAPCWYTGGTVTSAQARSGTYSTYCASTAGATIGFGSMGLAGSVNSASMYGRVAFRTETSPVTTQTIGALINYVATNGTTRVGNLVLRQNTNGTFDLIVNNTLHAAVVTFSGVAVTAQTWHVAELFISQGASGTYTVRLDSSQLGTGTGNFGTANIGFADHGYNNPAASNHGIYFDDIAFDTTDWVGTGRALSYAGVSAVASSSSGNITLTEPTGAASGDLLVAHISYRSNAAFTVPNDWTIIATQNSGGNTTANGTGSIVSCLSMYCIRGGSAPTLTINRTGGDVALGRIIAFRGHSSVTPTYDTGTTTVLAAASTTVTGATLNTADIGELLVMNAASARNTTQSGYAAATDPIAAHGWFEAADSGTTTGADVSLAVAYAYKGVAGATGNPVYTASTSARHGLILGAFKLVVPGAFVGTGLLGGGKLERGRLAA